MKTSKLAVGFLGLALFMSSLALAQNPAPLQGLNPVAGAAPVAIPPEVAKFMADKRAPSELSEPELQARLQHASQLASNESLPAELREHMKNIALAAKTEMDARAHAAAAPKSPVEPQKQQAAEPAPQPKPQVAQMQPQPQIVPLEKAISDAPAVAPDIAQAVTADKLQKLDKNVVDPAAEQQAKDYLTDGTDITKLNDGALRKRLDSVRELLAVNQLSQETERAVRVNLLKERDFLRQRMAQEEAATQQQAAAQNAPPAQAPSSARTLTGGARIMPAPVVQQAPPPPLPAGVVLPPPPPPPPQAANTGGLKLSLSVGVISTATPPGTVLSDLRPPDQLRARELQRRIQVYDDAIQDNRYDPAYRNYWRDSLDYNRAILRERLRQERRQRAIALANDQAQFNFQMDAPPPPRMPRSVFAAEVDDRELLNVLTTAPMGNYRPRYSVEDIAGDSTLREAIARVDVDTVHFGYNEGFIREEELSHLDNIATIIERVVRKYPDEVFLIEGHTDAVGSDSYNLRLSKLRAESVKKMMITYYVIPPRNLRIAGLGERFLKIPTSDPEPENRRVSVARITPLLGMGQ